MEKIPKMAMKEREVSENPHNTKDLRKQLE